MRLQFLRRAVVAILVCALSACAATGAVSRAAVAQQNTAVVLAFLDTVFNKHEVAHAFRLYVGASYRQHNPHVPDGVEGAVKALTHLTHDLYPELHLEVKHTVAQGDLVAVHSRYTDSVASRDSGKGGRAVVDLFRLEHGRIVEHWDVVQDVPDTSANDNTMF